MIWFDFSLGVFAPLRAIFSRKDAKSQRLFIEKLFYATSYILQLLLR
jgi:hypothetical protein